MTIVEAAGVVTESFELHEMNEYMAAVEAAKATGTFIEDRIAGDECGWSAYVRYRSGEWPEVIE